MKVRRRKRDMIFDASAIKTQIVEALDRDLPKSKQVQDYKDSFMIMLRDRQTSDITKKFVIDRDESDLEVLTYLKFLFVNDHMAEFSREGLNLPESHIVKPQSNQSFRDNVLIGAKCLLAGVLSPFDDDEWFRCCRNGTGSSIGVSYRDTSLEAKSLFPITVTSKAKHLLDDYLLYDNLLYSAMLEHNKANPLADRYRIVDGSRATTVPKNTKIRRLIAIEPTGNMFLQQGLMAMMYRRMKRVGLDLGRLPDEHKRRARLSSITSQEATIDWSSASDCVSYDLLRWLLPPKWFECIDNVRSPVMSIDGQNVGLNMISTMGNAGTFPLETLVFWALGQSTRLRLAGTLSVFPEWEDRRTVSVFGDDCICPIHMAHEFISICESVGFIVNKEKSYLGNGGFRESCGGDYYRGYDVRPFYLKAPTSTRLSALEPWLYIILNGLQKKYITYFGARDYVYDKALFELIFSLFRKYDLAVKLVPSYYPDDSGWKISHDISRFRLCYRFKLSNIAVSDHGVYTFLYKRFVYRKEEKRVDYLHYANWLKRPVREEASPWWESRKKGGYVVARGYSSCWSLPTK